MQTYHKSERTGTVVTGWAGVREKMLALSRLPNYEEPETPGAPRLVCAFR
jgi:hypothetical protein